MAKLNPKELKYTKEHEWAKVEKGVATIGITDHAQELLTSIVFVELPKIGKEVEQAKSLAVVESVKSVSDVYAPVSGQVLEVNTELSNKPELVNQDAFGEGWIAKIKIKDIKELDNLMDAKSYTEYCKKGQH
ncbi:glycine cleavage system protein GcvH [Candidatus Gottesmanbacteria bacterium]|nr:glycine cleavage system protein GcvH [Candidatus Gottesmanbacteria bacterium]